MIPTSLKPGESPGPAKDPTSASGSGWVDLAARLIEENPGSIQALQETAKGLVLRNALNEIKDPGKFSTEEQKVKLSEFLSPSLTDSHQRDAFAAVLAHMPDAKSAAGLTEELLAIRSQEGLDASGKNAQSLALISNALHESRQADLNPETKKIHQNLMADVMNANGISYPTANIAAKALDSIAPEKKANAIQLALGLAKEADPLKAFLNTTDTKLAELSGLKPEEASAAKLDIAKAGVKLLQDAGMDVDRVARTLSSVVDQNGNFNHSKMSALVAGLVKAGAPAQGASVNHANQWYPGADVGSFLIFGLRKDITFEKMNAAYNTNYSKLRSGLEPQSSNISSLYHLLKASGMPLGQSNSGTSEADLEYLKQVGNTTQSLVDSSNPFRITPDRTTPDTTNGKFELFTDKATNQQFYKLTKDGQERYAIKDETTNDWKFLQGNNFGYGNKSYADTISSFKESQALLQQPQILSRRDVTKDTPDFKYYETQNGTIALYQGTQSQYQNLIYKKDESGTYQRLSPSEAQTYQKAISGWGSKVNPDVQAISDANGNYRIYTTNAGNRVAVGVKDAAKGIVYTETTNATKEKQWTRYQEKQVVQVSRQQQVQQQYRSREPNSRPSSESYQHSRRQNSHQQRMINYGATGKFR